jgi:4-amino-4-deoxy-L-arabinose transferase-like glycosyltransferase
MRSPSNTPKKRPSADKQQTEASCKPPKRPPGLQPLRAHLRARWPDYVALGLLCTISAVLLLVRAHFYKTAGGLETAFMDGNGHRLETHVTPTVDLEGPLTVANARRVRWTGWLWVPYQGKFVFGLHFKGRVALSIAGQTLITARTRAHRSAGHRNPLEHHRKLVKRQLLVDRGWQPIRLDYTTPAGASTHRQTTTEKKKSPSGGGVGSIRLLWQPPGRRGDPEYVDPAFLRAHKKRPQSTGPAGLPKRDAWIATLLLVAVAACFLFWLRRSLIAWIKRLRADRGARLEAGCFLGLTLLALAIRAFDLNGAGQTWDEDVYFGAGRNYLQNLLALDFRPQSWVWNFEHPPVGKYLIGFGALWSEGLSAARAVNVVLGALTIGFGYLAGRCLISRPGALVGGALAALSPHLIGHAKIAAFETPSVFFYTLAVLAFLRAEGYRSSNGSSREKFASRAHESKNGESKNGRPEKQIPYTHRSGLYLICGLAAGGAIATRWLNFTVLVVLGVFFVLFLRNKRNPQSGWVCLHPGVFWVPLLAVLVPFLCWPRLYHQPVARLAETLGHYPAGLVIQEFFLGVRRSPPPYYFPVYFFAVVAPLTLIGWALFWPAWIWGVRRPDDRRRRALRNENRRRALLLVLWWAIPLLGATVGPMIQDGFRYALPALLPTCLMAGHGVDWLSTSLAAKLRFGFPKLLARIAHKPENAVTAKHVSRVFHASFGGVCVLGAMWAVVRIHPYYIDYYNSFWGGPKNVFQHKLLEFSWWGEGLGPAVQWINARAPKGARIFIDVPARHVMVFRPDIRVVGRPAAADLIVTAGAGLYRRVPAGFRRIHTETAAGAPVVKVFSAVTLETR